MTYRPYFYGRLYDLLALKELVQARQLSPAIIPIIEPVKDIAALPQTLQVFAQHQQPVAVIVNPQVGDYRLFAHHQYPIVDWLVAPSIIRVATLAPDFKALDALTKDPFWVKVSHADDLKAAIAQQWLPDQTPLIVPPEARIRRLAADYPLTSLFDHLWIPDQQADYLRMPDEVFSLDPVDAPLAGYAAFSDYLTFPGTYDPHGYPSKAFVFHVTYRRGSAIRIHHFVSTDRMDFKHPREKFLDVMAQVTTWLTTQPTTTTTPSLSHLLAIAATGKFPGAGTVKKHLIQHHLQVMNTFI